ncbi:MAG: tetratricopeptide repeat protein [Rubrivivax sp.]|nr:tetratricopeptide repeat protein [Pyrinomonadaceae bacterium]
MPSRGSTPAGAEDSRVTKLLDEGFDYAESGKWDEAIRSYSQAIGISPRNAEAYIGIGDAYMRAGKYKEGFVAYQQAVRVAPWNADAHYSLGAAHNDMAQYGDAFKPFVEAIRLDPDFAEAYFGIGYAYQWLQNYKDALGYLKQAVRLKPDYAEAHLSLGFTYHGLHDAKAAEEQLRILEGMDASLAKELKRELHPDGTKNTATAVAQNQTQSSQDERGSPVATGRRETTEAARKQTPARREANVRRQMTDVAPTPKRTEQVGDAASLLAVELSFWDSIKNSDDPEEFAAYLRKYPDGQFAELARIRMRALESRKGAIAAEVEETQEVAKAQPTPSQETPKPVQERAQPAQEQPQPDGAAEIAAKESGDLDSAATLDETLEWISKNFSNKFSYKYTTAAEDPNGTPTTADANVNYEPLKFEGCRIDWQDNADTLSVSLAELDPTSVKIEPRSRPNTTFSIEVWNLGINASGGKGAIREIKGDGSGAVNAYSGLDLQFDSRERAERLARALQSAIKLCGGKP